MCDPITALLGVAGLGASILGGSSKTKPPPAPAIAAPIAQAKVDAPVIKIGAGDDTTDTVNSTGGTSQVATRKAGTSFGGLGRSGLSLDL